MYVSWVLGDKLRIVMSSIMRWRRGEIGLVIGGLLSIGLHERAILADRTPPTDDPTPIGTANGPKGIYGRRSLSKPPEPTILDLSYRPHHKRLPRQRFSANALMAHPGYLLLLLRCVSPLMAQSGHPDMSAYLSAFGELRKFTRHSPRLMDT